MLICNKFFLVVSGYLYFTFGIISLVSKLSETICLRLSIIILFSSNKIILQCLPINSIINFLVIISSTSSNPSNSIVITLSKLDKLANSFSNFKIDLSPVDTCADIISSLILLNSSYQKVFHIYNNQEIKLVDLINQLKPENQKIKVVSDEKFYEYIKNKSDILGIINDLTSKSSYNSNIIMKNDFTINYMKNSHLSWPTIDKNYINKFFKKYINKGD